MPTKNSKKMYLENSYYHIYNRGLEKRSIFSDSQDYSVFLTYLKEYLSPKNEKELREKLGQENLGLTERDQILKKLKLNNFYGEIELLAYCLMPNHFHLLIKQKGPKAIDKLLNSLITRYVMFFNRRHQRIGRLFQGVYKAVVVTSEAQLLHLSRYIHRNPLALEKNGREHQKKYTSLPEYLGQRKTSWINTQEILSSFGRSAKGSYLNFVEEADDLNDLENLTIEETAPNPERLSLAARGPLAKVVI